MKVMRSVGRGVGKAVKPLINFPSWMGWKQLRSSGKIITDSAKGILEQPKATRKETFAQAVARFHLTEADIIKRMKVCKFTAWFYGVIALMLLAYTVYMMIGIHLAAAFLSLILAVLAGTLTLRQHFWYYQMKKRKLGCTLKEWFNDTFRGAQK